MPPRSVNRFNQREVARALRAVTDSGAAVDRVEIDPVSGKIAVVLTKPGDMATSNNNPWDEVMKDDSARKERAS